MHYAMIDREATGKRIKECMEVRGFTVQDVQKYLNLATPQAVYHWLNGRSLPSIDNLYALSEYLHVPMDSLVRGSRWPKIEPDIIMHTPFGDEICNQIARFVNAA